KGSRATGSICHRSFLWLSSADLAEAVDGARRGLHQKTLYNKHKRDIAMRTQSGLFGGLNPTVTVVSKLLVVGFVVLCAILAEEAGAFFQNTSDFILGNFKWFYLSLVSGILGL